MARVLLTISSLSAIAIIMVLFAVDSRADIDATVVRAVSRQFKKDDINGDGLLTIDELLVSAKKAGGGAVLKMVERDVRAHFKKADRNRDGFLTIPEVLLIADQNRSEEFAKKYRKM